MTFTARNVFLQNDGETQMVGFADSEGEPASYVLLQRSLSPTAQDKQLGHDQPHITFNDESRSAYGGILKISLSPEAVLIQVDEKTSEELNSGKEIRIRLEVQSPSITELAGSLNELTMGYCTFERLL